MDSYTSKYKMFLEYVFSGCLVVYVKVLNGRCWGSKQASPREEPKNHKLLPLQESASATHLLLSLARRRRWK